MSSDLTPQELEAQEAQKPMGEMDRIRNASLQDLQAIQTGAVISYKDQKLLLALYRGQLRRPVKVTNRLLHHGLIYLKPEIEGVLGREIDLTLKGSMALEHILKQKADKRARAKERLAAKATRGKKRTPKFVN